MFKPWFCFSFLAIHPRALLSAPLSQLHRADQHNQLVCLSHDFVLFTPYIQKIFSLPHCRVCAGFPKGRQGFHCDAILVQGFQWAALQYLYRGPTDVQGFHCDAVFVQRLQNGQLCNTCIRVQLLCRGSNGQHQFPRWPLCPRLPTTPCGPLSLSLSRASPQIRRQTSQIGEKSACFIFFYCSIPPKYCRKCTKTWNQLEWYNWRTSTNAKRAAQVHRHSIVYASLPRGPPSGCGNTNYN